MILIGNDEVKKELINRDSFKNNFLKQIIMRLDFQGVLSTEMEGILQLIKVYLKAESFNRYEDRVQNEIEFTVGDNAVIQEPVQSLNQLKIYSFFNDDRGYEFDFSTAFVILKINTVKYIKFEEYSKLFIDVCNFYRKKIDFFSVKRFGIRKINFCFTKTIDAICSYFNSNYYNQFLMFENMQLQRSINNTNMVRGPYRFNVLHGIEQGVIQDEKIYKVTIDADIYSENQSEIEKILLENKDLSEQNEELFNIFVDSLNDTMIKILIDENCIIPDDLLGVEKND